MIDAVILFLSLLAVLCQVFLLITLVLRLRALGRGSGRETYNRFVDAIGPVALPFAFAVALVTLLGSLFLSEVAGFEPCRLCWYQRAALYPLTPLLLVLLLRRVKVLYVAALALAVVDIPISTYHYVIERFPHLEATSCDPRVPCTLLYIWKFRYLSIPLMALTSALTILTLLLLSRRSGETRGEQTEPADT